MLTIRKGYFWYGVLNNFPPLRSIYIRNLKDAKDAQLQSIQAFMKIFSQGSNELIPFSEAILSDPLAQKLSIQLKNLLDFYGSDKSNHHTYQDIYAFICSKMNGTTPISILEIGLGSSKQPSMNAFCEFIHNNNLNIDYIGVDINQEFLIDPQQSRVKLMRFDQLDRNSALQLVANLSSHNVALIIDDGLHTAEANFSAFNNLISFVNNGAIYIIEDINRNQIPFWTEVPKLFPNLVFKLRNMTDIGPYDNVQIIIHNSEISWI